MNIKNICLLAVLLPPLAACGSAVDTGNMGVFTKYGKITGQPVGAGYQYYNVITTDLNEVSIRVQKWEAETESYTKDFQQAKIAFTLSYSLSPKSVSKVFRLYGADWESKIVPQVVVQEIKNVTGVSTAIDLIEKRTVAQQLIQSAITKKLALRGVSVTSFELRDISYSEAFEDAVEQKQVASKRQMQRGIRLFKLKKRRVRKL
jgi:prohibitin 1